MKKKTQGVKHKHKHCQHADVQYCMDCREIYCVDCTSVWKEPCTEIHYPPYCNKHHYWQYPHYTNTFSLDGVGVGSNATLGKVDIGAETTLTKELQREVSKVEATMCSHGGGNAR